MSQYKETLAIYLDEMNAEAALIFNNKGEVIESIATEHDDSVGAMSAAILSMCDKFLNDLEKGDLKQIHVKTTTGNLFFVKINSDKFLVVFNSASINLGLINNNLDKMCKELNNIK